MKTVASCMLIAVSILIYIILAQQASNKTLTFNDPSNLCKPGFATHYLSQASTGDQVTEFFSSLGTISKWPPRWQCGEWSSFHGWLYIVSDIVIWLSYFMIPLTLGYFVYKRKREPIPFKSIIVLFIIFILACGLTHLIDALIFWWPAYGLSALIRFVTATVSLGTVFALMQIAPRVIDLRSPELLDKMVKDRTAELQELNLQLQAEAMQREKAEQQLKELNLALEEKTKGLEEINKALKQREQDLIKSEEKILQLNAGLEKKVEERTLQLHTSNHELEAFTYSVSHDLRAPLRAIDGYARILEEDYDSRLDANGKRLIGVITKNAKYMGQLIDDLLEFSRTSRTELSKTWFHTEEEVKRISGDLLVQEKNRTVEIDLKPLEICRGDINMLRQVWVNLISNALKYSRKTEKSLVVIGCTVNEHEVQYYVKDNGVGFDMEYKNKLFGVFQRLHRKDEFEGTGVGLALVKRIIDRHGGRLWAEGKLGEGATFYFSLPR